MRHSSLSFVFSGLISVLAGACVASGAGDSVHGPDFGVDDAAVADGRHTLDDASLVEDATPVDEAGHDGATSTESGAWDAGYDAPAGDSGGCTDTTALVAGNATTLFQAIQSGSNAWTVANVAAPVKSAPALVSTGGAGFHAVIRSTGDALKWTATTGGVWSAPAAIGGSTTVGAPALATINTSVHLVYLGANGKYYHGTYSANSWDAASDPVGGSTTQSFGPTPVSMTSVGGALLLSHRSGTNAQLYAEGWSGGTWSASPVGTAQVELIVTSTIAMTGGTSDAMIAYVHLTDTKISYATRTGTTWSGPNQIANTLFTNDPVSAAPVPGGKAVLLWRGTDKKAYATVFDGASWSSAAGPLAPGDLSGAPSVAPGACADDAIAALPMAAGDVQVVRLSGGSWSAPVGVTGATGATSVAVATGK